MRKFEARGGIGTVRDAVAFVSPARLEVARDLAEISPALRQMRQIEEHSRDFTSAGLAQRQAMVAAVARGITHPRWMGVHEASHFVPQSDTNTIQGLQVVGEAILEGSESAQIIRSAATGSSVLMRAHNPYVESSVLTGGVVLGNGLGSNTKEFDSEEVRILLDITDGIHAHNGDQIKKGLSDLRDQVLDSYDIELYGRDHSGANEEYRVYGELDSAAMVFDSFYLPALQQGETTNIVVNDSIIASSRAFRQVLGGRIFESAIVAADPLTAAHVRVKNTYILSSCGDEFVESARYGDPDRATALVASAAELSERPLAAFAA